MYLGPDKYDHVTEYHVVYSLKPYPRWEVRWGSQSMGYKAWDKRVALSAAKEMAKMNRPSKVVIHDRKGPVQKELLYEAKSQKSAKGKAG
jgi:hypothetical protein